MRRRLSPTGTLTFTTAANVSGSATFNVVLIDNGSNNNTSAAQTLTITANAVNDAPSFTRAGPERARGQRRANRGGLGDGDFAGPADESGQTLTFNITGNTNPALFSVAPACRRPAP